MSLKKNGGFIFYFFLVFLNLVAAWFTIDSLNLITKPLLLLTLIAIVWLIEKNNSLRLLFTSALLFSFMGDVLLMFVNFSNNYFIAGLICFLLAHIGYILFFTKIKSEIRSKPALFYVYIFLALVYFVVLVYILYPGLGALKIPIAIYAIVISGMLITSMFVYFKVLPSSGKYFVTGALLFVISDSLLAFNKFYMPFFQAGFFIMLTYCLAQFSLVKGYINLQKTNGFNT